VSRLELLDVSKHYKSGSELVRAVDSVSLTLSAGELVGLYGPSGSGKTTLLLLAAGLLTPDSGRILFDSRDIGRMGNRQRARYRLSEVGFVTQSFHLMPRASALDNALIKLPAAGLTLQQARARTTGWLERVGLGARMDYPVERLSMGERQRVAIARALVNEPHLLLADEPTGNLDSSRTREILGLVRDICHERSVPGLLVTHDPEAMSFVDRVYTLRDGRLSDGLHAELAAAPS
jgi:putative ABC transport system ATP-binding protein